MYLSLLVSRLRGNDKNGEESEALHVRVLPRWGKARVFSNYLA
jgi:hypothetical protein